EGTQRVFYETLFKAFKNNQFTRFEAMAVTGLKKTQLQYHLNQLVQLEYLQQFGFSNRGFKYKIVDYLLNLGLFSQATFLLF
ncbi:hypothetical protein OQJ66_20665, partial [Aquimarina muelleri]|nr:hypothetical protein [Aquimarina muelleri]